MFSRAIKYLNKDVSKIVFRPCINDYCYCKFLIDRPEKTKITPTLLKNAYKCKERAKYFHDLAKEHNKKIVKNNKKNKTETQQNKANT